MPRFHTDVDAKSISRTDTVVQQDFGFEQFVRRRLENRPVNYRNVPRCQVLRCHRKLAGREKPTLTFFWSRAQRTERVAEVSRRVLFPEFLVVDVAHALHAQRVEYFFVQELE